MSKKLSNNNLGGYIQKKISLRMVGAYFYATFFFIMLFLPTTLISFRGCILATSLGLSFLAVFSGCQEWKIHKTILSWSLLCILASFIFIANGMLNDAPGALQSATVYMIWPLVYIWLIGLASSFGTYFMLARVIVLGTFFSASSGIFYVVSGYVGLNDEFNPFFIFLGGQLNIGKTLIEYNLFNIATLIFGFPFCITYLLAIYFKQGSTFAIGSNKFLTITTFISLIAIILTGRRAILLVAIISPILALLVVGSSYREKLNYKKLFSLLALIASIFLLVVLTAQFLFGISLEVVYTDFLLGFNFENKNNLSAYRRGEQYQALIDGWLSSPLMGSGHGAVAPKDSLAHANIWNYELQYIAILFQTGLVGIFVYFSAQLWLFYKLYIMTIGNTQINILSSAILVGSICFLIANATNPYLPKFDYLWVIFFPAGMLNCFLLKSNSSND